MSPFLRKVKAASGATAVQIVEKRAGRRKILEYLGSAHTEVELAALLRVGNAKLHEGQDVLDLGLDGTGVSIVADGVVRGSRSVLLTDVITVVWQRLGFETIGDEAFFQLVLVRLVEPTSRLDSIWVINELGLDARHRNTYGEVLQRSLADNYRAIIANACFDYVYARAGGDVSLLLYDVTTLFFQAEEEDEFRKPGYSKERRIDPQIVVGLLVDRTGFPLEIQCFEGNKVETQTLIPVIKGFQARHGIEDMVVVADAGMLSNENLTALEAEHLRFIVGSRMTKAPHDLAKHFHWNGTLFADGQIIDTVTAKRGHGQQGRLATRAESVSGVSSLQWWRLPPGHARGARVGPREAPSALAGHLALLSVPRPA
ncbi:IS1634 family transposase [Actinomycetaceae bacterium MB13-C1-2]|nr:IS1634 family transposase [Actinomycetaceae bacterium MB13-C1-2]